MDREPQNRVYVSMMIDALKRKESILTALYEQTQEQEILLKGDEMDEDRFQQILDDKGNRIEELNELDDGFDVLFKAVEKEIVANRQDHIEEIREMQRLIASVSDLGVKIQALEHQNSTRLQAYLATKRKTIREFHVNNKTVATYYKNMSNTHRPDQSYFINEKQ